MNNEFAEISDVTRLYGVNQLSAHEGKLKFKDKEVESKQFHADSTFFDQSFVALYQSEKLLFNVLFVFLDGYSLYYVCWAYWTSIL